ncbi:MAG: hypothetical protein GF311_22010 [Candidatus Lokiarchaeota archaeon]|nr:hypothetical protein [Candidatus Lokiarchaeota archaeon]
MNKKIKIKVVLFNLILILFILVPINIGIHPSLSNTNVFEENKISAYNTIKTQHINRMKTSIIQSSDTDQSGFNVAGIGDFNNDSYDDIAIGVPYNDEAGTDAGQVYLFFGKSTGWKRDIYLSNADASFIGEAAGDKAGFSVAGAGVVNNDGFDDIIIGAPGNDEGIMNTDAGQVYIIFGDTSGWGHDISLSNANVSFWGEKANTFSGNAVAGVGDVNNDTYDDILIGAYFYYIGGADDDTGKSYLIFGNSTEEFSIDMSLSADIDASFIGEAEEDELGFAVAGAGDVNNDDYDDILISAPYNSEGGTLAGKTYLFFGNTTTSWGKNINASQANVSFIGEAAGDQSGFSVAGAGDVNNDTYDDILISANNNNETGVVAGQVYIVFGNSINNWENSISLSDANASFIGEAANDCAAWSVAGANLNNDEYSDIIIGVSLNDESGVNAGQTYVFFGNNSNWSNDISLSKANISFTGEKAGDYAGWSVANAGDVNNDTYDDLLIGAPWNDEGGDRRGQTYLILGRASGLSNDTPLGSADASFRYLSAINSIPFPPLIIPEETIEIPGFPLICIVSIFLLSTLTTIVMILSKERN